MSHTQAQLIGLEFYLMGKIVVLSVLNGGPAPKFFPKHIQEYLFYGHMGIFVSVNSQKRITVGEGEGLLQQLGPG